MGTTTRCQKLSDLQVIELAEALSKVSNLSDLVEVANVLRSSGQTAFSTEEVDSIESAGRILDVPLEERHRFGSSSSRGLFLVFEGLDRSGKSTQSKKVAAHLEKAGKVKWMCFPDRTTPLGALIDLYLQRKVELPDEAVHRFFCANRWEAAASLVEDLLSGTTVVCDRYAFSGVAYSAAKGLDFAWCQDRDRGLPCPDGIFFLHIDEKVGASRANFGDERYENADMQARVRAQFNVDELRANVNWHDVNGARDIEVIHDEIRRSVEAIKQTGEDTERPIKRLWLD